jgi:two-component system chemotaxis response regulator CheY
MRRRAAVAAALDPSVEKWRMSLNVLIVDDSAVTRAMIGKSLRAAGLPIGEAVEAANGKEGLDRLAENWIDLVFVDINMPVMNGEEMIDNIRANETWADLPIVVVSTEGSQTRIESLRAKGTEFIHKPCSPETIRDVVLSLTGIEDGSAN